MEQIVSGLDGDYFPSLPTQTSVRLLRIHAQQLDDTAIECSLEVYDLERTHPDYIAVSYTRGPASSSAANERPRLSRQRMVSCNGRKLKVHQNLLEFLNGVEWWKGKLLYMWIDAICIYSYRTATKCCRNLRFRPQFCEGFGFALYCLDSNPQKPVRALGAPLGLGCSCQLHPPNTFQLSLLPGSFALA
jgi:hypothetical protein